MANEETQDVDAVEKDRRNDEYRAKEWAGLTDAEKSARKSEADALIKERDGLMRRGLTHGRLEEIDERLRALNYREEQSTNADVQMENARRMPVAEQRQAVAAGKVPADLFTDDDATKGKGNK
jgi:hypothetical protein